MSADSDRFRTAPSDPSGAIVTAIGYESEREFPVEHRGLPSPFLTLIVTLDEPVVLAEPGGDDRRLDVLLAGLDTKPATVRMHGRQTGLQAAIHPLASRRLFGIPAGELSALSVEGEDLLGRGAMRLRERLAEAPRWDERFRIFSEEMRSSETQAPGQRSRLEIVEAWRLLSESRGRIRIAELAERVFLSRRRLSTLFMEEFGCSPKEAARTMRFTHAIARIGRGVRSGSLDLTGTAAECGYADQSHLIREFHRFAGISPSGWIAEEFPNIQAGGHRYARGWES